MLDARSGAKGCRAGRLQIGRGCQTGKAHTWADESFILLSPQLKRQPRRCRRTSSDDSFTLLLAPATTFASLPDRDPAGSAKPPHFGKLDVRSSSVIVLDAVDSSVLYSEQATRAVPIASITKLMTALVVLDAGQPLDERIELTTADRRLERSSASRLAIGSHISRGTCCIWP